MGNSMLGCCLARWLILSGHFQSIVKILELELVRFLPGLQCEWVK